MRPFHRLAAGLAATLLAAPAPQAGANPRLGPDPVLGGGEYSTGGGLTVAVELREMNGRTGLCGVWAQSRRLTVYVRRAGPRVLSKGTIALDDRVLTHDLGFIKRVAPTGSYAGAPAGCVRLDRPWHPGDATARLDVRIPRQQVYFGQGGRDHGGPRITFRDTGLHNPAMTAGSLLPQHWTNPAPGPRIDPSRHRGHVDD